MQPQLLNHSPDLKRLWDEGLEIEIDENYLLIHHVPYVNSNRKILYGTLVSTLDLAGDQTTRPQTHVIHFVGDHPCNKDGSLISSIQNASAEQRLTKKTTINHSFSNKPPDGYADYYQKITRYIEIISAPAQSVHNSVTEKTYRVIEPREEESVFNYLDTNSGRAEINIISQKLADEKIAIVGLGGTGSYILDFVAKTPVKEIHVYDGDIMFQHNAFRAPGALSVEELKQRRGKTEHFRDVYSRMHRHIISHPYFIDEAHFEELADMSFVFMSIDKGKIRKSLTDFLELKGVSFIDAGMGIERIDDQLIGILRTTSCTGRKRDHLMNRVSFIDDTDNEYSKNIQIAELNAFNAALAVIKWKKFRGFYQDLERENFTCYTINTGQLLNEDHDS